MKAIFKAYFVSGFVITLIAASNNQWRCDNGEIIQAFKVCDGAIDCSDYSDETISQCNNNICDAGYIQCSYGACVKNESDCLGQRQKNTIDELTEGSCRIMKIPPNGYVQYLYSPGTYLKANDIIPNFGKVQFTCIDNHGIVGEDTILCRESTWNKAVPECEPFCPSFVSSVTIMANCILNDDVVNCMEPAKPTTVASIRCKYGYESVSLEQQSICGTDARWHPEPTPCSQICGQRANELMAPVPWQVTIFKRDTTLHPFKQICGGSILNAKMVLTAYHCFLKRNARDKLELFIVATGNSFIEPHRMGEVQAFSPVQLHKNGQFQRENGYQNDLAILIVDRYIEFNQYVSPICIDYQLKEEERYVSPGLTGIMGNWGKDFITLIPDSVIKIIELSVITREQCKKHPWIAFGKFVSTDKFCARRIIPGTRVFPEDSGSGLAFPIETNGKIKYFLRGFANILDYGAVIDNLQYSRFVSISTLDAIEGISKQMLAEMNVLLETNTPKVARTVSKLCTLTDAPRNCIISYLGTTNKLREGQVIQNFHALEFECEPGYTLKGKPVNVCLNGTWSNAMPNCIRRSAAQSQLWNCDNGTSIELTKLCDGKSDCLDYSDETSTLCEKIVCGAGLIKCPYGACVRNSTECRVIMARKNEIQEAAGSCKITNIPPNGSILYLHSNIWRALSNVDDNLPNLSKIKFTCNGSHRIVGESILSCRHGTWDGNIPECEPYCHPVVGGVSYTRYCHLGYESINCVKPARPGTIAYIHCNHGYENVRSLQRTVCGNDGQWQPETSPCTKKCGELTPEIATISNDGHAANITHLPWHVTIFKQKTLYHPFEYICGGTILNARLILSAKHCVFDEGMTTFADNSLFKIETGINYNSFYDNKANANNRSSFTIVHVLHHNSLDDMAVLILHQNIEFNVYTSPICIDYEMVEEAGFISPGLKGIMGRWSKDVITSKQNIVELSAITREKCKSNSSEEFLRFFGSDKFCAESPSATLDVFAQDSGSGLAFPIANNGKVKYFLRGVASICFLDSTCDSKQYFKFQNTAYFMNLISSDYTFKTVETFRNDIRPITQLSAKRCGTTVIPTNGYATLLNSLATHLNLRFIGASQEVRMAHLEVGVTHQVVLVYSCNDNFTLKGDPTNVCLDGAWTNSIPECIPFATELNTDCRAIPSSLNGHIQYYAKDGFLLGNNKGEKFYGVGTRAKINCLAGFEISIGSQQTLTCDKNANWSPDLKDITCRPICGKQAPTGTPFIAGGQETNITYAPWHVGIYKVKENRENYACGGSILTERIVISAIHCFWDRKINAVMDVKLFKVAAGKQYFDYQSTNEPYEAQFFNILDLNYYSDYRHLSGNFAQDIVLVLLDKMIIFQSHIAPICVQTKVNVSDMPIKPGFNGTLAGWGLTQSGKRQHLKIVELPTVDRDTCKAHSEGGFEDFLTPDKFCAGHLNMSTSACQGDGGGGLVFPKTINESKRYFLRGIVSVGSNFNPRKCDSSKYTTFTNVIYHEIFIRSAFLNL